MADTYSDRVGLILQEEGTHSNEWGDLLNLNFRRIDTTIRGYTKITLASETTYTLTAGDITAVTSTPEQEAFYHFIEFDGTVSGTTVVVPAEESTWHIYNNTDGNFTFEPLGGTGVTVAQGAFAILVYRSATTTMVDMTVVLSSTFNNRVFATLNSDVDLSQISGSLIVGGDGTAAHIAVDANEIQAKANGTTAAQLFINFLGGNVSIGDASTVVALGGDLTVKGNIYSPANTDSLTISGGGVASNGGNLLLIGSTEATNPGDFYLRNGANNVIGWDESTGILTISTGTGTKTDALVIDNNQDVKLTGDIFRPNTTGTLTLAGGSAAGSGGRIQLVGPSEATVPGDVIMTSGIWAFLHWKNSIGQLELSTGIGASKVDVVVFDSSQNSTFTGDIIIKSPGGIYTDANTGEISVSGGGAALNGGNIGLVGGSHASFAGDVYIRSGANKIFDWDESTGILTISTGTGTKTDALAITASQNLLVAGDIFRNDATGTVAIAGGSSALNGGSIEFYGGSHATLPGDIIIRSGATDVWHWDESAGTLTIATASGTKTDALIINASQQVNFKGAVEVEGNVGFYNTTPISQPTVTGSKGGNAALGSLMTALSNLGLVTDSTT